MDGASRCGLVIFVDRANLEEVEVPTLRPTRVNHLTIPSINADVCVFQFFFDATQKAAWHVYELQSPSSLSFVHQLLHTITEIDLRKHNSPPPPYPTWAARKRRRIE